MSSRSSVLQPSQYTYLDKTTHDMLALKCFTIACILTSFASDYNSNTVVDLAIDVLPRDFLFYILFLQSLLPRSFSFTIFSSVSEVSLRQRSLHCVLPTQNTRVVCALPPTKSPSLLSSALRCRCCYWFSIHVFLCPTSVTLSLDASCLEVLVYSFSIVEATILRIVYCRFLVLVCVVGADISSRRRYPWSVFLILAARSCGHIGGYRRLDDTCPLSAPCIVCS